MTALQLIVLLVSVVPWATLALVLWLARIERHAHRDAMTVALRHGAEWKTLAEVRSKQFYAMRLVLTNCTVRPEDELNGDARGMVVSLLSYLNWQSHDAPVPASFLNGHV